MNSAEKNSKDEIDRGNKQGDRTEELLAFLREMEAEARAQRVDTGLGLGELGSPMVYDDFLKEHGFKLKSAETKPGAKGQRFMYFNAKTGEGVAIYSVLPEFRDYVPGDVSWMLFKKDGSRIKPPYQAGMPPDVLPHLAEALGVAVASPKNNKSHSRDTR